MLSLLKILLRMLCCVEFERWRKEVERLPEKITQKVLKLFVYNQNSLARGEKNVRKLL